MAADGDHEDWKKKYFTAQEEVGKWKNKYKQKKHTHKMRKIHGQKTFEEVVEQACTKKYCENSINVLVGWVLATVLALISLYILYDSLWEAGFKWWTWLALGTFFVYLSGSCCLSIAFCIRKFPKRLLKALIGIVTFLTLFQFPIYYGLLAWGFPYVVEPKALTNISIAYDDPQSLQTDMSSIAKELEWTFERKEIHRDTGIKYLFGENHTDFVTPKIEVIGLAVHSIPIVAAIIYQFGIGSMIGSELSSGLGVVGIIMDFIDVQDFYLLLFENDIVVSYWSRPHTLNTAWGQDVNFGQVLVKLVGGANYTYRSEEREFEDWQIEESSSMGLNTVYSLLGMQTFLIEGQYYKYWIWRYILIFYILASAYVTIWPWITMMTQTLISTRSKRCRTFMQFVETFLSLGLIEWPFLLLRFACSYNYGIVMSSLILKNMLSIVVETLKLVIYVLGLNYEEKHVIARQKAEDTNACRICCDASVERILILGKIIGFDPDDDSLYDFEPLCCHWDNFDDKSDHSDASDSASDSDKHNIEDDVSDFDEYESLKGCF